MVLAIVVQMAVTTMVLHGRVESIGVIRSILRPVNYTPGRSYFLSVVVEQLEESRQRLSRLVPKAGGDARARSPSNVQLGPIFCPAIEIIPSRKAEAELQETFEQLKVN